MFDFLGDLFNNTIGALINGVGKMIGDVLRTFGLDRVVTWLASTLSRIPGFDALLGGVLKMIPEVLRGQFDLGDAVRLASLVMPPPLGAIANTVDLGKVLGGIVDHVGLPDAGTIEHDNLISVAQNAAFAAAEDMLV